MKSCIKYLMISLFVFVNVLVPFVSEAQVLESLTKGVLNLGAEAWIRRPTRVETNLVNYSNLIVDIDDGSGSKSRQVTLKVTYGGKGIYALPWVGMPEFKIKVKIQLKGITLNSDLTKDKWSGFPMDYDENGTMTGGGFSYLVWTGIDDSNLKMNLDDITVTMESTADPSEVKTYKVSDNSIFKTASILIVDNRNSVSNTTLNTQKSPTNIDNKESFLFKTSLKAILSDIPEFQPILDDSEIMKALECKDDAFLINNTKWKKLMTNPRIGEIMQKFNERIDKVRDNFALGKITAKSGLNLRETPSTQTKKVGGLAYNTEVIIIDKSNNTDTFENITSNWYKITDGEVTGWAFGGFIEIIGK